MYAPLVTGARSCRSILKSIEAPGQKTEEYGGCHRIEHLAAFSIAPLSNRGGFECKVLEINLSSVWLSNELRYIKT